MDSKLERILHYFAETTLPVMVSEDYLDEYESLNSPFPQVFIDEVLTEWETEIDEFTEFSPCFKLPAQDNFYAVVYWKGGLLRYDFVLVTLDKKGEVINRKSIANTLVTGNIIKKSIASIEPDLIINIIAGQTLDGEEYDASMSKSFAMEILPNGHVIFSME